MLKLCGILCMLLGSTGIGILCARDLDLRTAELAHLQRLMLLLRGEIRYMHQPLPEAFLHISGIAPPLFADFLRRTADGLRARDGRTADEIWSRNLDRIAPLLHISGSDLRELKKLGNVLGYLDVEMQIGAIDYYLEQIQTAIARAAQISESRRRLYRYLGVLGGAALAVLVF